MSEVDSNQPNIQRRRSQRISDSLPLIVHGTDLLGQPFDERTTTVSFNLHGCRYTSKHHLPRNTWVTLEVPENSERRNVRARVAWVQRPHSIRDFFQIAVELESPVNIWGIGAPPADWAKPDAAFKSSAGAAALDISRSAERADAGMMPPILATFVESAAIPATSSYAETDSEPTDSDSTEGASEHDSPLLRGLESRFGREAATAIDTAAAEACEQIRRIANEHEQRQTTTSQDFFAHWKGEFERAQAGVQTEFSAQLTARQQEFLSGWHAELQKYSERAGSLMAEIEARTQQLRDEREGAQETASRLAQARLQIEAAEAAHKTHQASQPDRDTSAGDEDAVTQWRQRLASEMRVAESQWNELLQSSLDGTTQRLIEQLSERSQEILRTAERRLEERFAEIQRPVAQTVSDARDSLSGMKSAFEREASHARASLAEIENSASRMKESSAQFEAASQDTINQLHRRLEAVLEMQTAEMNRRAESLAASLTQRMAPALEALGEQTLSRMAAELETRLAPHVQRIPELLHELSVREEHAENSLGLHRERLRQASDHNQREVASQMAATLAGLRNDFEAARKDALTKWMEELEAGGVRASHSAAEAISRASEWFQQEARARLQVLVEQTMASAEKSFDGKSSEAMENFGGRLEAKSSAEFERLHQRLENACGELVDLSGTQIGQAADAAAASFGEVLRVISDKQTGEFRDSSRIVLQERSEEMAKSAQQLLGTLETSAAASLEGFHLQMASQLEKSIANGRGELASEFASALENYRAERSAHHKEWAESLELLAADASVTYQDRLHTSGDSWVISSVRRLNEHGQDTIESLIRSADQSLRESFSKVFEGLAETVRDRMTAAAGVAGFAPPANLEGSEPPSPGNESTPKA